MEGNFKRDIIATLLTLGSMGIIGTIAGTDYKILATGTATGLIAYHANKIINKQ